MGFDFFYSKTNKVGVNLDYRKFDALRNTDLGLVHYSLTDRGSALYFQKIIITKIFRMSLKPINGIERFSYSDHDRLLDFGTDFQTKYSLVTTVNQLRRGMTTTMFGNDSASVGSFKNFFYKSATSGNDSFIKHHVEQRDTQALREKRIDYLANLGCHSIYLYNRMPSGWKFSEFKSLYVNPTFSEFITFNDSTSSDRVKEKLIKTLTNITFFIRTVWYRTNMLLANFQYPFTFFDYNGTYRRRLGFSGKFFESFAADSFIGSFSALGNFNYHKMDIAREVGIVHKGGAYKRLMKRYSMWRMGIVHWGKKMLAFKKNYSFWKYARGLSNYYYRGFYLFSIFNCRADVFVMKSFGVRTLKFARLLVWGRHVFSGNYALPDPRSRVFRYNIVTISEKANIYLTKKKFFKYWKNDEKLTNKKIKNRLVKMTPLTFCRQQKQSIFWGDVHSIKYTMFFGNSLSTLNAENKKTRYFALNYYFTQRIVSTSWW